MKRLLIVYSLAIAATPLFIGCDSGQPNQTNKMAQTGNKNVVRNKTSSGLEYEILKEGSGASPKAGQSVQVHYTGWLDNKGKQGAQFDSSIDRGQPFTFIIGHGRVIKGWDEGVMSMKVGEKRRLFIPAELGYGSRGAGGAIPPHANLIFDVELIKIS